jgi:hypothetical protein
MAVPFRIDDYAMDLQSTVRTDGMIRLDDDVLVIEFRATRTSMMTLRSESEDVEELRIPVDQVDSFEVGRRWPWGAKLRLRTRSLGVLQQAPGVSGNEMAVRVRRRDYDRARELSINVSLALSSRELRRLDEGGDA